MPIYTRANLKSAVAGRIHNKSGMAVGLNDSVNNAVREVISEVDLRSMKRKGTLAPSLFNDYFQYTWPTDAKGHKIVGLQPQNMERNLHQRWEHVAEEEFDQRKQSCTNLVSFADRDGSTKLLVSASIDDYGFVLGQMDSLTEGSGTWSAFGDATNLSVDTYEVVKGSGSIKFDISAAGGTTAGLQNTGLSTYDLTNFASNGSVFAWVWITSTTGLTNFKLRVGNNSSNYYEMTATTQNDGTAFIAGLNLIRFDFSGKTTTGSPVNTTCTYAAIYMTKLGSKISETDYRVDYLAVKRGKIHNLIYYSKYGWQSSSGTWKVDSTADSDYLNADVEEFNLFVEKLVEILSDENREDRDSRKAESKYEKKKDTYQRMYKSEALPLQSTYYYFN